MGRNRGARAGAEQEPEGSVTMGMGARRTKLPRSAQLGKQGANTTKPKASPQCASSWVLGDSRGTGRAAQPPGMGPAAAKPPGSCQALVPGGKAALPRSGLQQPRGGPGLRAAPSESGTAQGTAEKAARLQQA